MKLKISIQYILEVVEFICDIHQVMGHVLLVLRGKVTYIWSQLYIDNNSNNEFFDIRKNVVEYSNLLAGLDIFLSVRVVHHGSDSSMSNTHPQTKKYESQDIKNYRWVECWPLHRRVGS